MKDYTPSQEELAEMRGAFGPGKEIVDVITGKKIQLWGKYGKGILCL